MTPRMTPEDRAQVIAAWKAILTPEVIVQFRNRARGLKLGPILNLVLVSRARGDVFLSQFNLETGDPFDGMLDQSTKAGTVGLPIAFMLFGNDPQFPPNSGTMNEKDKPIFEQPKSR